jgi:protein-tyrosine phosphatase
MYSFAGISRSASVVIAYLMKELGLPMLDAMTYTRKKRSIIFPNPGFQKQLFEYEKQLRLSNQRAMVEYQDKKK